MKAVATLITRSLTALAVLDAVSVGFGAAPSAPRVDAAAPQSLCLHSARPAAVCSPQHPRLFSSRRLGIRFTYLAGPFPGGSTVHTKEVGRRVYVYAAGPPQQGQYVEVFPKKKTESLQAAIRRQLLAGYSSKKCFVELLRSTYNNPNYVMATIAFPVNKRSSQPWWLQGRTCPQPYTRSNGISYFLADRTHPDRFLFFSIGQYPIMACGGKAWQDTITFL